MTGTDFHQHLWGDAFRRALERRTEPPYLRADRLTLRHGGTFEVDPLTYSPTARLTELDEQGAPQLRADARLSLRGGADRVGCQRLDRRRAFVRRRPILDRQRRLVPTGVEHGALRPATLGSPAAVALGSAAEQRAGLGAVDCGDDGSRRGDDLHDVGRLE
jgi:hypothetical protein